MQRSANKARTQALNQIHQLLITAPDGLRARLTPMPRREQLATFGERGSNLTPSWGRPGWSPSGVDVHSFALRAEKSEQFCRMSAGVAQDVRCSGVELHDLPRSEV